MQAFLAIADAANANRCRFNRTYTLIQTMSVDHEAIAYSFTENVFLKVEVGDFVGIKEPNTGQQ